MLREPNDCDIDRELERRHEISYERARRKKSNLDANFDGNHDIFDRRLNKIGPIKKVGPQSIYSQE